MAKTINFLDVSACLSEEAIRQPMQLLQCLGRVICLCEETHDSDELKDETDFPLYHYAKGIFNKLELDCFPDNDFERIIITPKKSK